MRNLPLLLTLSLSGLVAAGALAGCSSAPPADIYSLGPARFDHVQAICRSTVGVSEDDAHFGVCVDGLAGALHDNDRAQILAKAEIDCAQAGGPDQALCVLRRTQPQTARVSPKPFRSASTDEIKRRLEVSCAKLGLNPASGAFDACVSTIQGGFASVDTPVTN